MGFVEEEEEDKNAKAGDPLYEKGLKRSQNVTEDFKKELEEEYGSININLEDGTYTPIEKEEDKK